jgi:hypothetical protein
VPDERESEFGREPSDEFRILLGFVAAQPVVKVQDAKVQVPKRSEFAKNMEQTD